MTSLLHGRNTKVRWCECVSECGVWCVCVAIELLIVLLYCFIADRLVSVSGQLWHSETVETFYGIICKINSSNVTIEFEGNDIEKLDFEKMRDWAILQPRSVDAVPRTVEKEEPGACQCRIGLKKLVQQRKKGRHQ